MTTPNDWPASIWQKINEAVRTELGKVRIGQQVFPTMPPSTPPLLEVPDEVINFEDLSIEEGRTKPFWEILVPFALTDTQVVTTPETKIATTLAIMTAKIGGLTEDGILFNGENAKVPANSQVDRLFSAGQGLLGEASPEDADDNDPNKVSVPIEVPLVSDSPGRLYAQHLFSAITSGISKLVGKGQPPPYALFVPPEVYADAHVPEGGDLGTYGDAIRALMEGGFHSVSILPKDSGLMVSLPGDPVTLYEGIAPTISFVRQEGSKHYMHLMIRGQYVVRDPRAFVRLNFALPEATQARQKKAYDK